jgi:hypothetical protein
MRLDLCQLRVIHVISVGTLARLAQNEKPGRACGRARGGGGLGAREVTLKCPR